MEKRVLLFVVLTMLTLFAMQYFQPPAKPPVKAPAGAVNSTVATSAPEVPVRESGIMSQEDVSPETAIKAPTVEADEKLVSVETDLYSAVFTTKGGTLRSFELKEYQAEDGSPVVLLREGARMRTLAIGVSDDYSISERNFELVGRDLVLSSDGQQTGRLTFSYRGDGFSIRRHYEFSAGSYVMELEDTVTGLPHYQMTLGSDFGLYKRDESYLHVGPVLLSMNDREEFKPGKVGKPESYPAPIKWIALEDKYFAGAVVMRDDMEEATVWPEGGSTAIGVRGAPGTHKLTVYGGPKEQDILEAVGGELKYIVDFGFFSPIARPIFWLLKKLYYVVGNYGVAIILLTIMIRVPFIPLVNKGQKSMKKLQELQPRIKDMKERYKNDPDRMNKEMMGLYSKHKVNPIGGCLPLILQIPVFFALYKVLLMTIELRGAPFAFWIHDLSMKDPYYITPVLMGATMLLQQKMTPTGGDERMRKMLMWMPIVFTFISFSFPSGLVLYWLVNNLLSITQQFFVNRAKDTGEEAA
jgi:YidC/Oxa1 family membrane protein insertase